MGLEAETDVRTGRLGRGLAVVALCLGLVVAGCGGDDKSEKGGSGGGDKAEETAKEAPALDVAKLESSLKDSLSPSSSSSISGSQDQPKVQTVDCPDDVPAEQGAKFKCEASGEQGLTGSVDVELRNAEGTDYKYKGKLQTDGFTTESSGTVTTK